MTTNHHNILTVIACALVGALAGLLSWLGDRWADRMPPARDAHLYEEHADETAFASTSAPEGKAA